MTKNIILALLLMLTINECCKAGWGTIKPKRPQASSTALADIDSQLDAGHPYVNTQSKSNWGHETLHGVNSRIRIELKVDNGYYLCKGQIFTISTPNFTLTDIANAAPSEYRKRSLYKTYLVEAAKDGPGYSGWDKQPFYVIDELVAYIAGCQVALEYDMKTEALFSYQCAEEMWVYTKIAQELARKSNFTEQKELDDFLDWVYNNRIRWLEQQFKKKGWN